MGIGLSKGRGRILATAGYVAKGPAAQHPQTSNVTAKAPQKALNTENQQAKREAVSDTKLPVSTEVQKGLKESKPAVASDAKNKVASKATLELSKVLENNLEKVRNPGPLRALRAFFSFTHKTDLNKEDENKLKRYVEEQMSPDKLPSNFKKRNRSLKNKDIRKLLRTEHFRNNWKLKYKGQERGMSGLSVIINKIKGTDVVEKKGGNLKGDATSSPSVADTTTTGKGTRPVSSEKPTKDKEKGKGKEKATASSSTSPPQTAQSSKESEAKRLEKKHYDIEDLPSAPTNEIEPQSNSTIRSGRRNATTESGGKESSKKPMKGKQKAPAFIGTYSKAAELETKGELKESSRKIQLGTTKELMDSFYDKIAPNQSDEIKQNRIVQQATEKFSNSQIQNESNPPNDLRVYLLGTKAPADAVSEKLETLYPNSLITHAGQEESSVKQNEDIVERIDRFEIQDRESEPQPVYIEVKQTYNLKETDSVVNAEIKEVTPEPTAAASSKPADKQQATDQSAVRILDDLAEKCMEDKESFGIGRRYKPIQKWKGFKEDSSKGGQWNHIEQKYQHELNETMASDILALLSTPCRERASALLEKQKPDVKELKASISPRPVLILTKSNGNDGEEVVVATRVDTFSYTTEDNKKVQYQVKQTFNLSNTYSEVETEVSQVNPSNLETGGVSESIAGTDKGKGKAQTKTPTSSAKPAEKQPSPESGTVSQSTTTENTLISDSFIQLSVDKDVESFLNSHTNFYDTNRAKGQSQDEVRYNILAEMLDEDSVLGKQFIKNSSRKNPIPEDKNDYYTNRMNEKVKSLQWELFTPSKVHSRTLSYLPDKDDLGSRGARVLLDFLTKYKKLEVGGSRLKEQPVTESMKQEYENLDNYEKGQVESVASQFGIKPPNIISQILNLSEKSKNILITEVDKALAKPLDKEKLLELAEEKIKEFPEHEFFDDIPKNTAKVYLEHKIEKGEISTADDIDKEILRVICETGVYTTFVPDERERRSLYSEFEQQIKKGKLTKSNIGDLKTEIEERELKYVKEKYENRCETNAEEFKLSEKRVKELKDYIKQEIDKGNIKDSQQLSDKIRSWVSEKAVKDNFDDIFNNQINFWRISYQLTDEKKESIKNKVNDEVNKGEIKTPRSMERKIEVLVKESKKK